jgi:cyclopropane fatty-acyl-phospholipid synthase-like methyltransferase
LDRVYSSDESFFGENPRDFAQKCYNDFKKYEVKRILELGCGQERDTIFFASNGLDVHAIDSSKIAVGNINQKIRGRNISLHLRHLEA